MTNVYGSSFFRPEPAPAGTIRPMKALANSLLTTGMLLCIQHAFAEELTFRFEAVRAGSYNAAPTGSLTAQAAQVSTITGQFGFDTAAQITAGAGIPGRVSYATYATGFIEVDELDLRSLNGTPSLRVGDGVLQEGNPALSHPDDLIVSYDNVSLDKPIDTVSIRLNYKTPDALDTTAVPAALKFSEFESATLTFSNRIDSLSSGRRQPAAAPAEPSMVTFKIIGLELRR